MKDLQQRIARLTPEQRALLMRKLGKGDEGIPLLAKRESQPLSFAQQRLWFLDQLQPDSALYNIPTAIRLSGLLHVPALEHSLNELVRRHETLRTTFRVVHEEPMAFIAAATPLCLETEYLDTLPRPEQEETLARLLQAETSRPFDLTQGPLLRAKLIKLGELEHVFLLTLHHIISDGWSTDVLKRELSALYQARLEGQPSPLPDLPIQYADFAAWQRQWLRDEVLQGQLSYWKKQLASVQTLNLPTDHPRPLAQSHRGGRINFTLPEALSRSLNLLGQQENSTLFMTLLAAFQVLLHRHTGQDDIVVGTPIAGRNRPETTGLIGFFVNTLVLRGDLSGDPTFRALLARIREMALQAYTHQDVPFEKLVSELAPQRNLSHHPLFQVMFTLQNASAAELTLHGVSATPQPFKFDLAKFDLTLSLSETATGLRGMFEYSTDLFDASSISRMAAHFQILLQGIAANPQARLSELPLLTEAERRQLLLEWNDTARDYPTDLCVHQLFEAQAARTPDAVALTHEGQQLSYAELNARANQLAHYLRGMGVAEETRVAIFMERSFEMVVGLLGVLKAGAAFVPLGPDYPAERLAIMLADSAAVAVLTQARLVQRLPQSGATRICLDTDWPQIMRQAQHVPPSAVTPHNLAYVIHTSGSTGVPKGVAIEHHSIAAHCHAIRDHYQLTAADKVFQFASLSFDASLEQLLPPLCVGASVVLGQHQLKDPAVLDASLRQHGVTLLNLPPAFFQLWLRLYSVSTPPPQTLRLVILGGDNLARETVLAWQALAATSIKLINGYGPTEATITSTLYSIIHPIIHPIPAPLISSNIPIGRPLNNTRAYVLDSHLQPVPIGVTGELHLGGGRLARGYLNQQKLTDERFIHSPFGGESGARLYRTGDLARYQADGNIEFLGRVDQQVKISGFRIELGEIEATLLQHPAVLNAAAQARDTDSGSKILAAFIVKKQDMPLNLQELRNFLGNSLPGYLIPNRIFLVSSLPLTPNGKLDRNALLNIALPENREQTAYREPYNSLQATLLQIWSALLELPKIGINENFFELGGDSYRAVIMLSRVEKLTRWSVPLATIYNHPTVESLAQAMLEYKGKNHNSPLIEIQSGTSDPPFIFMHGDFHGGGYYCHQLARFMGPTQAFYALQPHGLPGHALPSTIEEMASEYLALIRQAFPQGPYFLGGHCNGALVAFEIALRLQEEGSKVGLLVMMDPSPVRGQNATPSSTSSNIDLDQLSPVARHNTVMQLYGEACKRYTPRFYRGKATLFLTQEYAAGTDPTKGWRDMAETGETHLLPGNHVSMLTAHAPALARQLVECRNKTQWD